MHNHTRSSRPPVVLIADDQEWSVRSLESVLGPRGYAVLRAYTGRQALALARTARPDAMVLDYRMPDMSGAELCEELRADPRVPLTVPIIVIAAGSDSRAHRMDAYRAGAWEVCGEPLDAEILLHKLDRFLEAKFFADQVREQSLVDPESGLYNLKGFARRARELGADLTRRGVALSCVAFSPTVESLTAATEAGADEAAVAEYLGGICRRSTRMSDLVGRIGPSEFAVLAPGMTDEGAARLADRIADAVVDSPLRVGGAAQPVRLRVVQTTVANAAESPLDAVDLLQRTTGALRTVGVRGVGGTALLGTPAIAS
jgi:PleD family two-component response regulator